MLCQRLFTFSFWFLPSKWYKQACQKRLPKQSLGREAKTYKLINDC